MTFAALILILALAFPAAAETVTIRSDGGGNISDYRERRRELAKADEVRITGACLSACTIFTTLPNACVAPNARIGFHGASVELPFIQRYIDGRMGEFYRGEVRRMFYAEWRHLRGKKNIAIISGRRLNRLDPLTRLCRT